jgi:FtsH-binding integral membrane protein
MEDRFLSFWHVFTWRDTLSKEDVQMVPIQTSRWSGAALIIGSTLFIVNKFDDMSQVYLNRPFPDLITGQSIAVIALGQIALVLGFWGCYLLYAKRTNLMGKIGLVVLVGGAVLLAIGHISFTSLVADDSPFFILVILGVLLMVVGLTVFGAVNLRTKALQYWQSLPLITGLLGFVVFVVFGNNQNPEVFLLLRTLFGAGLVVLGLIMWQDSRQLVAQDQNTGQQGG